jgi:chorismate synthase
METDRVEILGGVRHGKTLGSPVSIVVRNLDHANWAEEMSVGPAPEGWASAKKVRAPRPGHADLAGSLKHSTTDPRDILERASARETAARVAAGALCLQLLEAAGIGVGSHVLSVGDVGVEADRVATWEEIAAIDPDSGFRCAVPRLEEAMRRAVDSAREAGDTLGGRFEVVVRGAPPGLGSHTQWDRKLDGRLMAALGSIPGVKAAEVGEGVRAAGLRGSRVHDEVVREAGRLGRPTNRAGGLEGGVSNGEEIRVRAHMKPLSTLMKPLRSVDLETGREAGALVERSDVCSVPAAAVVGEAMTALVVADALLEKCGGDSLEEMLAALEAHRERAGNLFPTRGVEE